ncbi:12126_t:CDS:10 [Ambispora leptoticha]|uniref:12126_t:CDS:1 n=1 Tax=Ambispora leptoticha TaxID=144679 RepID=A0A9N9C4C5_9GLOM|nr:12126_t:CDS:10 [Ambispora leptoticha]
MFEEGEFIYEYEHRRVIKSLLLVGIRCERDLLLTPNENILSNRNFYATTRDLELFRKFVQDKFKAVPQTGLDLLQQRNCVPLSTGCEKIDNLLSGGIYPGEITEISGPSGTGKTQMAFFTAITTVISSNTVLYIDTLNGFSSDRVVSLFLGSDRFASARDEGIDWIKVLECIRVVKCFDVYSVMEVIEAIGYNNNDHDKQEENIKSEFYQNLKLIVIDSISAVLSSLLSSSTSQGHSLMVSLMRMLLTLAKKRNIGILLINTSVHAYPNNQASAFASTITKPALGMTWTYLTNVQLYITDCPEELHETIGNNVGGPQVQEYYYTNREGVECTMKPRIVEVLKSRNQFLSYFDNSKWDSATAGFNDFLAGYISGVAGLIVGSPLDVLRIRLQMPQRPIYHNDHNNRNISPKNATVTAGAVSLWRMMQTEGVGSWFKGIAAPIIGLAFLNAILFASYGGILRFLGTREENDLFFNSKHHNRNYESSFTPSLSQVYVAGFGAGIASFFVSTPTEVVKCKAQALVNSHYRSSSTWSVFRNIIKNHGILGLYQGGTATMIRDSTSYGVYFWAYEGCKRLLGVSSSFSSTNLVNYHDDFAVGSYNHNNDDTLKLLFSGGMAGVVAWACIYPLDVIKTRLQVQPYKNVTHNLTENYNSQPFVITRAAVPSSSSFEQTTLLQSVKIYNHHQNNFSSSLSPSTLTATKTTPPPTTYYTGIIDCAIKSYKAEGSKFIFKGIVPTLLRAWPVNAVTFYVYEIMIKWLN